MQDYSISRSSRKCATSERALEPGESYVSAIVTDGDEGVRRIDVALEQWKGPSQETVGWWRCKMPDQQTRQLKPAPNGVLLDTLSELLENPESEELSYLLALLLVRRRVLTEEVTVGEDEEQACWKLTSNADNRNWNIPLTEPDPARLIELQTKLQALLFTEE